jgi:hypothetical protein
LKAASFLGNGEVISEIFEAEGGLTAENVFSRLEMKGSAGCEIASEIEFAASQF